MRISITLAVIVSLAGIAIAADPQPAKDRNDADVYVSGSFLAGQGTKPLYTADIKLNLLRPLPRRLTKWGLNAEMLTNTGTEIPVSRTEADPDSIKGSLTFTGVRPLNGVFNGLFWALKPAGGEFTRKHPLSNFTTD